MKSQDYDVVIIGAGVAGSMTAINAARQGLRTLLVERHTFPRHKVCGCCLNARAVEMLRTAGLMPELAKLQMGETSALAIRCRGSKLNLAMPKNLAISRLLLDEILAQQAVAAGVEFRQNTVASLQPLATEIRDTRNAADQPSGRFANTTDAQLFNDAQSFTDAQPFREIDLKHTGDLSSSASTAVRAGIAVICDGLGHPSLARLTRYQADPVPTSRIGLGAVFARTDDDNWIEPHAILMAVAPHGYAGIVEIEGNQLNLAAAIDPSHLNRTKSPLRSLQAIFESAGVPCPARLSESTIKGTIPLTRTASLITGHRLLLLGDSTGYIEPFTGEGMAWAMSAATAVTPFLCKAVKDGWSTELEHQWRDTFRRIVQREQKICRFLSSALRRSWLLPPLMLGCRMFPSMTRHLVAQINRVPQFAH